MLDRTFFSADLHLLHKNILSFDGRPFEDLEHMSAELIRRWNETVSDKDTVYMVGDLAFGKEGVYELIRQLKGRKILVRGNHDDNWLKDERCRKLFAEIVDYKEVVIDGWHLVISHYPIPTYKKSYNSNSIMIYGHVHDTQDEYIIQAAQKLLWMTFEHKAQKTQSATNRTEALSQNSFLMVNVGTMHHNYAPVSLRRAIEVAQERNANVRETPLEEFVQQAMDHA